MHVLLRNYLMKHPQRSTHASHRDIVQMNVDMQLRYFYAFMLHCSATYMSGVDKAGIASVREPFFFCIGVPCCYCCCCDCYRTVTSIAGRACSIGGEPEGGETGF
jgi:hypothetical protein